MMTSDVSAISRKPGHRAGKMKPEMRRAQLLESAVRITSQRGIGSAHHADIAKACNVAVPTVFSYFPTRDELVSQILNEVGRVIYDQVMQPTHVLEDRLERLYMTATNMIETSKAHPDYVKVWLMWSMHFAPDIQAQYRNLEAVILDELSELLQEGSGQHDPDKGTHDRARLLMGASAFLSKMVFDGVDERRRQDFVDHVLATIQAD